MIICPFCKRPYDAEKIVLEEPELLSAEMTENGYKTVVRATLPCCKTKIEIKNEPQGL